MHPESFAVAVRCLLKSFLYLAILKIKRRDHVVFQGLVYPRGIRGKCLTAIRNTGQRFEINIDKFGRVLSCISIFRNYNSNGLTDITNLAICQYRPIYIE